MIRNYFGKKCLVIGIIFLFVGSYQISIESATIQNKKDTKSNLISQSTSISDIDWWPMYRHDQFHTGFSNSTVSNISGQVRFEIIGNTGSSSPAVVDNRVYIGCMDNNLYCFNCSDGDLLWVFPTNDFIETSPAVSQGRVYISSCDGNILCINASTGSLIWANSTSPGDALSSPVLDEENLYIGNAHGELICLNASTGTLIWSHDENERIWPTPAVDDTMVFFASDTGYLQALNKENGSLIWSYKIGTVCISSPAIAYGRVYIGSDSRKLHCFNATTGVQLWQYQVGLWVYDAPAVFDGKVYFGACDNKIYCLDAIGNSNGTTNLIWSYTTGDHIWSSPAVADNKVFITSRDGNLYCLDALSGVKLWNYSLGDHLNSSPTIVDGKLYVGSDTYGLYSFGWGNVPPNPASDPFPKNGVMRDFGNLSLNWTGLDRNPLDILSFDIYFGTSNPPPLFVSNYSTTSYHLEDYEKNTTYYWKVVTWDNHGESCEGPLWEFTTGYNYNECLDTNDLTFSSGGNGHWFGQKDFFYYDSDALQSDEISYSQWTWLQSTVHGPGTLSFYWNVSSEAGYDFLDFSIDGVVQCNISGNGQWEQKHFNISEGVHILFWNYSSDYTDIDGLNCGWVDCVEWINGTPTIPDRPRGPSKLIIGEEGTYETRSTEPHGRDLQYRFDWDADGSHEYSAWTTFYPSGENISMSRSWTQNISCVIKVQARDIYGYTSVWSEGLRVDVTSNHQPNAPTISGNSQGQVKKEYIYHVSSVDPEEQNVSLFIDWGDETNTSWLSPIPSGSVISLTHAWDEKGTYIVKAKAKDTMNKESNWTTLQVTMPLSFERIHFRFFEWLLERFPNAFPLLRFLVGFNHYL